MSQQQENGTRAVRVRVNTWVDELVAPLVEALNDFPDLMTLDSSGQPNGPAWVTFSHRDDSPEGILGFIQAIAAELQQRLGSDSGCRVGLQWEVGGGRSLAKIEAPAAAVGGLSHALTEMASTPAS